MALKAYIVLNVLFSVAMNEKDASSPNDQPSYRDLSCFQDMLAQGLDYSGIAVRPHSEFWQIGTALDRDVPDGMRRSLKHFIAYHRKIKPGRLHFPPVNVDIGKIRCLLRRKGLPTELTTKILQHAGFLGKHDATLTVPWDPFHPLNRKALLGYLDHCWQIIVRCNVMWEALDRPETWRGTGHEDDHEHGGEHQGEHQHEEGDEDDNNEEIADDDELYEWEDRMERWPEWDKQVKYSLWSMSNDIREHFESKSGRTEEEG